ncbi:hypothetical protein [Rubellimicrobium roseum]|uniref:Roadblock/LC7 domain-containing protein n=1 Tax=Rubellimicrobium roseum TaxID=687525 RepID=A0A5C4N7J8_9RHOB|nr:hypothetical protein [Rubellimicrobium roseum]TNC68531.1 hypothetical protein FHG71_14705 [Rubellimicrobium roseum]
METTISDMRSVTAIFDEAAKAERAIAWLRNIGVKDSQIRQSAAEVPEQARPATPATPPPAKRRRSFVDSFVDFMMPDDAPKGSAKGMANGGPRIVTILNVPATMQGAVTSILNDEGQVQEDRAEPEAPSSPVEARDPSPAWTGAPSVDMADANQIRGLIGACLVDGGSGHLLAAEGDGRIDLELVAALNTDFMRTWNYTVDQLELDEDTVDIDEILMTMDTQIHLFRPLEQHRSIFLYVALDKATCNLGMARLQIRHIEANLAL